MLKVLFSQNKFLRKCLFSHFRQKDGSDLLEDGKVKVISEDDGYYKLVIRDVKFSDAGLYACIAKNKNGTAKSAATLRVRGLLRAN